MQVKMPAKKQAKDKLNLDWFDDIPDLDLPYMMTVEPGWHLLHVDLGDSPAVNDIEIPDKQKGGKATKEIPQLDIIARFSALEEFSEHAIPFWGMKAFKEIVENAVEQDLIHGEILEVDFRVTKTEDKKHSVEFRHRK